MIEENNKTLWCGNLSEQVTEELLYELFLQAGPLEKVRIAKDRDGRQKNFAFITYCHEVSVPYAISLLRGTALFHRTLSLQSKGNNTLLPPPIRCFGPEPTIDFQGKNNVAEQFANMTNTLNEEDLRPVHASRQGYDLNDKLVQASLQGNWSHRHHPYRQKDNKNHRDLHSNNASNRSKHTNNWRDRRNHRMGGGYHRRD